MKLPKVKLVPVADAYAPSGEDMAKRINDIYLPYGVEWTVETLPVHQDMSWDDGDEALSKGDGFFSMYSDEMKALNKSFQQRSEYQADAVYLFLMNAIAGEEETELLGDMPVGSQFGYLQANNNSGRFSQTIAHELGHGLFQLWHTFSDRYNIPQYTTNNLMDYPASETDNDRHLVKYQWDVMHDPQKMLFKWLQGEEEGEISNCYWFFNKINEWFPGEMTTQIQEKESLYNNIYNNFEKYFTDSKEKNVEVSSHSGWTVRKASHDYTIIEKVILKLIEEKDPEFNLHQKGVFLGKYKLEEKDFKVAVFTEQQTSKVKEVQVEDVCDLTGDEAIMLFFKDNYILISFFDEKKLKLTIQITGSNEEIAKLWLKYLGIYVEKPGILDKVKEWWESLLEGEKDDEILPEFPVTRKQVEEIFPTTDKERIKEVVDIINKYSNDYGLTTKTRMAHFLGQIGTETAGLEKLKESSNYSAKNVFSVFLKVKRNKQGSDEKTHKYCDLIEGYDCSDLSSCPSGYGGPNRCSTEPDYEFPMKNGEPDYDKWLEDGNNVKTSYVNSSSLFDYVYCCRMGNGAKNTKDGSTYLGKGFIHMTGKDKYKRVSEAWNKKYPDDKKEFHGDDIDELENNVEIAMKASLVLWEEDKMNDIADGGTGLSTIKSVTKAVNGGYNGLDHRKKYTDRAVEVFDKDEN